jgi:uncharacterized protein YceK
MKRIVLLLPVIALLSGCSTQYNITLQNGQVITSIGKPVYDKENGVFIYKTTLKIPAGSVRQIEPAGSKSSAKDSRYLPVPTPDR